MQTVFCECKKCGTPIGRFANLWTRIGKSYFSPVVDPEDDLAIRCRGAVRIGEQGTLVEQCQLQDVVCSNCAALVGLRCIQTPVNHVLDENQLLLRLASVELLDDDGKEIELVIRRVLSVTEPSRSSHATFPDAAQGPAHASAFPGAVELQQLQIDLNAQREDIKRIDSNGFRIVTALDKRTGRIGSEVTKLDGTVCGIRRDIGNIQQQLESMRNDVNTINTLARDTAALEQFETRLAATSGALGEVKQQVAALGDFFRREAGELRLELDQQKQNLEELRCEVRNAVTAADFSEDMADLRAEMAYLREQLGEVRTLGVRETAFPPRELEVLTNNIAKIGNRASQVETLQMELEMLKGRVERAEASRGVDDRRSVRGVAASPGYSEPFPPARKRAASPSVQPVSQRPASAAGYASFSRYATPVPVSHPAAASKEADGGSSQISSVKRVRKQRNRTTGTSIDTPGRLRQR